MAYRGPTFVPEAEWTQMQARRFDEMAQTADLPSEPIRVENDRARFDEMAAALPHPSEELRVSSEQARFDALSGKADLPSLSLAPQVEEARFDEMAAQAPLPSEDPVAGPPPDPAAPPVPPPGAPVDDDPVSKTLAFLRGLGGGPSGGSGVGGSWADAAPPEEPVLGPSTGGGVGGSWAPGAYVPDPALDDETTAGARALMRPGALTDSPLASAATNLDDALTRGGTLARSQAADTVAQAAAFREQANLMADKIERGEPITPADRDRALALAEPFATAMTGEPLKIMRGTARALAGAVAPAGGRGQPGLSLEDVGRSLPPLSSLTDNYRKPLSAYTDRLYHETDAGRADEFLPVPGSFGRRETETFLATSPDLALGQGTNRGVLLEFDAAPIQGQVNTRKPAWQPLWEQGDAEFIARHNDAGAYTDALRAVTVKPDVAGTPGERMRLRRNLQRLEGAGWTTTTGADGSVTYRRPSAPTESALGQPGMSLEVTGGPPVTPGGDSGPGVVYHDEIELPKGPSEFRKYWDRSRNVLGSMGEQGQEIAQRVHAWRDGWKDTAGDWATRMPDVWALSKNEFTNLVDVLEGTAKPVNARVATAQTQAKAVLDDVYALAQNAGVDVASSIDNYFPHRYATPIADQLKDARRQRQVAEELMRTGQAASPAEAREVMVRYMQAPTSRRHGSLEMERLANLEGYEKTKEVLIDHLVGTAKRIHEVAQFGPDDAIVNRLFDGMRAAGYAEKDLKSARNLFQVIVGAKDYEGTPLPTVASGLRKYNALTRLGWAGIANATQGVNTATVTGVLRTLQSVPKAIWSREDKEFALRAGLTLDNVLKEMRASEGTIGQRLGRVAMPGFAEVEKFNRTLTAVAGRDFAVEQAAKAANGDKRAVRALTALGLDADAVVRRGGVLDPAEQRQAARSIDERTQFQVDSQDLPGWADSPWGKVVNQFGSFAYNQSAFVGREVLGKALEGDVRPLVRFLVLAPLAQAAADETRNLVQGREPEQDPTKRVAQYVLGPLGKVGSVARAVLPINSDRLPPERQAAMIAGAVLGPSLGTLTDAAGALVQGTRGNPVPAERLGLRQIPVVGTTLQNMILPYEKQGASRYALPGRPDTSRSSSRPDTSRKDTRR